MENSLLFKFDQRDSPHRRDVHSNLDLECRECQVEALLTEMALLFHADEHPAFDDACHVCAEILVTETTRTNLGVVARKGAASHRERVHPRFADDCALCHAIDVLEAPPSAGVETRRMYFRSALAHSAVHADLDHETCSGCLDVSALLLIMAAVHRRDEHPKAVYGCYLCMRIAANKRQMEAYLDEIPAEHQQVHPRFEDGCNLCRGIQIFKDKG